MPFFSVIIPTFNSDKFIEKTLKTVLNQTFTDFEVIIVDDGSKDNTVEVLKKYSNNFNNIKVVTQKNSGVSVARNKGIDISVGNYLCFLDSDDLWESTYLECMYNEIKRRDCNMVICGMKTYSQKINSINTIEYKITTRDSFLSFLKGEFWGATGTWTIDSKVVSTYNIRFPEEKSWAEDLEFFLKCLLRADTSIIDEKLFTYVLHENSLSDFSIKKFNEIEVWKNTLEILKETNYSKKNELYSNIITEYRIPMVVIRVLFESIKNDCFNYAINGSSYSKEYLSENIRKYKFPWNYNILFKKIYIYKLILNTRFLQLSITNIYKKRSRGKN